jgi:hypothetical protein
MATQQQLFTELFTVVEEEQFKQRKLLTQQQANARELKRKAEAEELAKQELMLARLRMSIPSLLGPSVGTAMANIHTANVLRLLQNDLWGYYDTIWITNKSKSWGSRGVANYYCRIDATHGLQMYINIGECSRQVGIYTAGAWMTMYNKILAYALAPEQLNWCRKYKAKYKQKYGTGYKGH